VYSSTISRGWPFSVKFTPKFLGLAAPKTMILDLDAFNLYLQLLEYAYTISGSSSGVEATRVSRPHRLEHGGKYPLF